jgi:nicotinamide riboside kinase
MMGLVVNLIGPPGTGKSTMAAEIFSKLKWKGVNCELVGEFAKELVWEDRYETMKDEIYLYGKQHHRIFRLDGKVDVIVTDRPLILSVLYNNLYGDGKESDAFTNLILHSVDKFDNYNILLKRTKAYAEEGRVQSEKESDEMRDEILSILNEHKVDYTEMPAMSETSDKIVNDIMGCINDPVIK